MSWGGQGSPLKRGHVPPASYLQARSLPLLRFPSYISVGVDKRGSVGPSSFGT